MEKICFIDMAVRFWRMKIHRRLDRFWIEPDLG
jgi:hypothetical protein